MMRTCILLLAVLLMASSSSAQPPPSPAPLSKKRQSQLKASFKRAQDLYKASRYADALPLFQQISEELGSPNALLYVARCLGKMGHQVQAYRAMLRTERWAAERAATEPRFAATAQAATTEREALQRRVGRLRVRIPNMPTGTVIEVAGSTAAMDAVVIVEPGAVRIEVRAAGYATVRREKSVIAGSETIVEVPLVALVAPASPVPTAPTSPPVRATVPDPEIVPETAGGEVRVAGFVVLGVSAAGWVTLLVAGVMSDSTFADVEDRCVQKRCTTTEDQALIDRGRDRELAANIGLGIGIGAAFAGGLMVLLGGPSEVPSSPPIAAALLPGGGFVVYTAAF